MLRLVNHVVNTTDSLTDLFDAVSGGHLAKVTQIVSNEISAQAFINLGSTLLHQAANNQHTDVLEYLLEKNAYVDCRDANMTTPLMVCAHNGDAESIQLLLKYSADVNAVDYDRRTPLYFAAYDGHTECIKYILLQENLDLKVVRKGGWTALHEAARFGHVEVVETLITHGLDVMATTDDASWTPGHMAASSGRLKCLELLIEAAIDVNAGGGPNKSSTLLHEACHHGHDECIKLLLNSGANPLLYDGHDYPHHLACKYGRPTSLDILLTYAKEHNMAHLVDTFTDADPEGDSVNYNNALHMAAYYGRKDCLEVLLKHNAKNVCNGVGRTPEILTVFKLHIDCLKLLITDLKKKIQVIVERRENEENDLNPLYYLCRNAYKTNEKTIACACLLLNSGLVDVNQNEYHQLCLETAVQSGAVALVRYLLVSGADPYMCHITKGLTQNKNLEMCSDLIEDAKTEPKSLLLCSRIKIRENLLNSSGMEFVYSLPLPRQLKNYVYHGHYNVKGICDI